MRCPWDAPGFSPAIIATERGARPLSRPPAPLRPRRDIASADSSGCSEMAERGLPKCERLTGGIEKARRPLPRRDRADLGDCDAGCGSLPAQCLDLAGR